MPLSSSDCETTNRGAQSALFYLVIKIQRFRYPRFNSVNPTTKQTSWKVGSTPATATSLYILTSSIQSLHLKYQPLEKNTVTLVASQFSAHDEAGICR